MLRKLMYLKMRKEYSSPNNCEVYLNKLMHMNFFAMKLVDSLSSIISTSLEVVVSKVIIKGK